ncbi:MAG: gluconokinase [Cyclobacteriaceae bacterium]|nr:gluconokinase [Cyclobacteriaceae bacterium]
MQFVIAIDIGTTSTKVLAVQPDMIVRAQHQVYYPTHFPQPGYAEQDAVEILQAVLTGVETVVNRLPPTPLTVVLSSAMHSLLAVDKEGQALSGIITWADTRSTQQAKELQERGLAEELHRQTGTPIHPMSPLCKLMWLRQHQPALFAQAFKFISIKEFIVFHLTGKFCVDYSIASATGLFDIHKLQWHSEALNQAGISTEQLSDPVPITHRVPVVHSAFLRSTQLILGASDGCLAQWGSNALALGKMTITVGTSGAVRRMATRAVFDAQGRLFNYILNDDVTITGGATNNGTAVLDWFARELADTSTPVSDWMEQVVKVPAGSEGLLALPFLQGERAPFYNPDARGVFFNVAMHHTRLHFAKALLESICYELKWIAESVEEVCGPSETILVSGGITHFPSWVQLLADVVNRSVIVSSQHDASALGAARLAFQVLRVSVTAAEEQEKIFRPQAINAEVYQHGFQHFKRLYTAVAPYFSDSKRG